MSRYALIALALAVFVVHSAGPPAVFHYDDEHSVADNPHIRSLSNVGRFFVDPAMFSIDPERSMYRPVLLTTYALDYALSGGTPQGLQRTNRAVHALNAALVALLAWQVVRSRAASLAAGALFGVHPMALEPAHYISARSDGLVTLFVLLAMILWLRRQQAGGTTALAFGLWTKATAIAAVPAMWISDRRTRRDQQGLTGWYVAVGGVAMLWITVSWLTRFLPTSIGNAPRGLWEQALTQTKAVVYYARLAIWPIGGSVEPEFQLSTMPTVVVMAAAALLLTMSLVTRSMWKHGQRRGVMLAAWAIVWLAPVLVAPLNVLVNERRAYLPLAAFAIGLALLTHLLRRTERRGITIGLLAAYVLISIGQSQVWASEVDLWENAVSRGPQMPRAHLYLGDAYRSAGRDKLARQAYERVVELQPRQRLLQLQALNGLALLDIDQGSLGSAHRRLTEVLEIRPHHVDALVNLGTVFYTKASASHGADRASLQQAMQTYRKALALAPTRYEARLNLGACLHLAGDLQGAQTEYGIVRRQAPTNGTAAANLGLLYRQRAAQTTGAERRELLLLAQTQYEDALRLGQPVEPGLAVVRQELSGASR